MLLPLFDRAALAAVVCPPLKTATDVAWELTRYCLAWKVLYSETLRAQVPKSFVLRPDCCILSPPPGTQPGADSGSVSFAAVDSM